MEIDVDELKRDWAGFDVRHGGVRRRDREDLRRTSRWPAARPSRATPIRSTPTSRRCRTSRRATSAAACCPTTSRASASGFGFDGGKCVTRASARSAPATELTAKSQIHDIYDKTGSLGDDGLHRAPHGVPEPARRAGLDRRLAHGAAGGHGMSGRSYDDVEFGDELPAFAPDVSLENVRRFARRRGHDLPALPRPRGGAQGGPARRDRAGHHEPGHPGRADPPLGAGRASCADRHHLPHADPGRLEARRDAAWSPTRTTTTRTLEIDLTIQNEAGETRVVGTATVELP